MMKHSSMTAISAALLFAAATAAPALAQSSGAPTPGNAPPREYTGNSSNSPQSVKDKPTASGGMSINQATGGLIGTPRAAATPAQPAAAAAPSASVSDSTGSGSRAVSKSSKKSTSSASMEKVKAAQQALNRNGASITADGKMGPKTKAAIRAYQQKNGLSTTGNLDSQTMQKLGVS